MSERPSRRARTTVEVEPEERTELRKPQGRFAGELEEPVFDYENDLYIDPNFLDAEWLNHSNVFMKYSAESARASKASSFAEERVKTKRSELIRDARSSGDKHTETSLEANYRLDPEYMRLKRDAIEAEYYANLMTNAVFAFQARKVALENLVRLQGQGYNSEPQAPRDLPEAAQRFKEQKEHSVESRIKERTNGRG